MRTVYREEFKSLNEFMNTINKRPNNEIMRYSNSSHDGDEFFTKTESYSEAVELMTKGYTDVMKQMKDDIKAKERIMSKYMNMVDRPVPHNAVCGYIPNVPAALQNLPNSMINVARKPMKRKTLAIDYAMHGNCNKSTQYFLDAGTALVSAIDIIERSGIQTKLRVSPKCSCCGDEVTFPTIVIKDYGERYALQKITFPMVHPSMFRRFGFAWLETTPQIKYNGWHDAYGRSMEYNEMVEWIETPKDTYLIDTDWIAKHNNSVEEILKMVEVI